MRNLNNTQLYCIKVMQHYGHVGPAFIANLRWPRSKQVHKKAWTIRKHCEQLVKHGYARAFGPWHFTLTDAGKRMKVSQLDRPIAMRLAR